MRKDFPPIYDCVLESTAIAQKAAQNYCFSSAPAGETSVRPMCASDRPKSKNGWVYLYLYACELRNLSVHGRYDSSELTHEFDLQN